MWDSEVRFAGLLLSGVRISAEQSWMTVRLTIDPSKEGVDQR